MMRRGSGFRGAVLGAWLVLIQACSLGKSQVTDSRAANSRRPPSPPTGRQCARDGIFPSREGFFQEVLFAEPTARTPRFDDYTAGSYHVNKLDLVRGLPDEAKACGLRLKAALVIGPVGVLWTYHVAALIAEGQKVRVNALVMPHARITGKGTGLVSVREASAILRQIKAAPLVQPGLPTQAPDGLKGDFSYRVLLAMYDTEPPEYFYAEFNEFSDDPRVEALLDRLNELLAATKTKTY